MVSRKMDEFMNSRLQELTGIPLPYGNLHLLRGGDIFQLAPVSDSWIFASGMTDSLWTQHVHMFELQQIVRQKDRAFAELLNRLREGRHTAEDVLLLQSTALNHRTMQMPHLYYTNANKDFHNALVADTHPIPATRFAAHDSLTHSTTPAARAQIMASVQRKSYRDTCNLHAELSLAPGIPVEVCCNFLPGEGLAKLGRADGCTNGAYGIVREVDAERGIIWVHFHNHEVGEKTRAACAARFPLQTSADWTPIPRVEREFHLSAKAPHRVCRKQFPLNPATARTVHHTQGSTITTPYVADFVGNNIPAALVYVANSRASELSILINLHLTFEKIKVDARAVAEMKRLRSDRAISFPPVPDFVPNKVCYLNVGSQRKQGSAEHVMTHLLDVLAMPDLMNAAVIILTEAGGTRIDAELPAFTCLTFPAGRGMVVFVRTCLSIHSADYTSHERLDILDLQLSSDCFAHVRILAVYRSPKASIPNSLAAIRRHALLPDSAPLHLLMGDFNLPPDHFVGTPLQDTLSTMGLLLRPVGPTTNRGTAIDHVFATHGATCGVYETYFSIHKALWCTLDDT